MPFVWWVSSVFKILSLVVVFYPGHCYFIILKTSVIGDCFVHLVQLYISHSWWRTWCHQVLYITNHGCECVTIHKCTTCSCTRVCVCVFVCVQAQIHKHAHILHIISTLRVSVHVIIDIKCNWFGCWLFLSWWGCKHCTGNTLWVLCELLLGMRLNTFNQLLSRALAVQICVCVCVHLYMYLCIYMCVCASLHACICVYMCVVLDRAFNPEHTYSDVDELCIQHTTMYRNIPCST